MSKKYIVHVEEILVMEEKRAAINKKNLDEIDWFYEGQRISIPPELLEEWKFIGRNNIDFITTEFYKGGEAAECHDLVTDEPMGPFKEPSYTGWTVHVSQAIFESGWLSLLLNMAEECFDFFMEEAWDSKKVWARFLFVPAYFVVLLLGLVLGFLSIFVCLGMILKGTGCWLVEIGTKDNGDSPGNYSEPSQ